MKRRIWIAVFVVALVGLGSYLLIKSNAQTDVADADEATTTSNGASGVTGASTTAGTPTGTTPPELVTYARNPIVLDRSVPLKERLDEWLVLARKDPSTAYDVGTSVSACAGVVEDDASIERRLQQGGAAIRSAERMLERQVFCAGLTKQDFDAGIDLMDRAARSGLVKAQEDYVYTVGAVLATEEGYAFDSDRIAQFKRNALSHLQNAANSGSAVALSRLSEVYEQGTVVPADPGLAVRYYKAYLERSGTNSRHSQARLAQLEELAREKK